MTAIPTTRPHRIDDVESTPARAADGHHDPHLAHHFDSSTQQLEAAKLGMWLFLATEILLFGGLFCLYAVFRRTHYDVFAYGSQFLDTRWGIINTAVLITSSMTMALAVTAAQRGQYRWLVSMLIATFVGGAIFMTVKYVEYHHKFHERLVWGASFYDAPEWALASAREHGRESAAASAPVESGGGGEAAAAAYVPDVEHGRELWDATCRSCHGVAGEGITGQGKDIRGAAFITERSDRELVDFIKVGRMPFDPLNTTGIQMPPKGGNPLLKDNDLFDIVGYMRTFDMTPAAPAEGESEVTVEANPDEPFWIPKSSFPVGPEGPPGLDLRFVDRVPVEAPPPESYPHHAVDPERPANAHLFFGLYFCMTGLHGLHVLAGMAVIAWLAWRAIRRDFGPHYYTPVDLGGLYWHIVDIIWIFLFPLLYLIA